MTNYQNGSIIDSIDDISKLDLMDELNEVLEETNNKNLDEYFYKDKSLFYDFSELIVLCEDSVVVDNMVFFNFDELKQSMLFYDYDNFIAYMNDCYIIDGEDRYKIQFSLSCNIYEINNDDIFDYIENNNLKEILKNDSVCDKSIDKIDITKPYIIINKYISAFYTEKLYKQL